MFSKTIFKHILILRSQFLCSHCCSSLEISSNYIIKSIIQRINRKQRTHLKCNLHVKDNIIYNMKHLFQNKHLIKLIHFYTILCFMTWCMHNFMTICIKLKIKYLDIVLYMLKNTYSKNQNL